MKLYRSPLSLIFLFVPLVNLCQTAWGQNEIRCEMRDQFLLNFRNESADQLCPQVRPSECQAIIERIRKASNELRAKLTEVCDGVNGLEGRLSKIAGQRDHYTAAANILGQTSNSYGSYLSLLQASYNSLGASMGAADGPLGPRPARSSVMSAMHPLEREREDVRTAIGNRSILEKLDIKNAQSESDVTGTSGRPDPKLFAFRNGASFMKKILQEKEDAEKIQTTLNAKREQILVNARGVDQVPGSERPGKRPSSTILGDLDLKSLASLASAGMGLAQALKKNDSPSPNLELPPPAPPSNPSNGSKAEVAVSKFGGDGKSSSGAPIIGGVEKKHENPAPPLNSVPSGGPFRELSDISESKAPPRDSVASPSVAKATGASSGAPQQGPGTESGSAEKHENEMLHKKEDDSPSFNGNMGGGTLAGMGGSPGSPSPGTDSPQSAAEETMKDLLHEMKETAESGSPNGGLEGDGNSFPMSEEDLFPRVKACYLRSLKRGKVLNGIGEKISEETQ